MVDGLATLLTRKGWQQNLGQSQVSGGGVSSNPEGLLPTGRFIFLRTFRGYDKSMLERPLAKRVWVEAGRHIRREVLIFVVCHKVLISVPQEPLIH